MESSELSSLVEDARLFLLTHKTVIESAPLQTYNSAIIFSPKKSLTRRLFLESRDARHSIINWIKLISGEDTWSSSVKARRHKLESHCNMIWQVAFSASSNLLASASWDGTARLWNPGTGECKHTLGSHTTDRDSFHPRLVMSVDGSIVAGTNPEDSTYFPPTIDSELLRCLGTEGGLQVAPSLEHCSCGI